MSNVAHDLGQGAFRDSVLESGRRALKEEAQALSVFADSLDDSFTAAVQCILSARGRVVCSGMGKSGYVARKIAATFSSTGTPALYVNPAEACHGDLGMITSHDVVLLLSNSGETREIFAIIDHSKRCSVPLVAITGAQKNTLRTAADVKIRLPAVKEACPMGLSPTTSTTLFLAVGDALAIALMKCRAFTPDHFHALHPGGAIGARLLKVRDVMHGGDAIPVVHRDTIMTEVVITMSAKGFGSVGVVDDEGFLTGIITDGDLRRHVQHLFSCTADEVATHEPCVITSDQTLSAALLLMQQHAITSVFVVKFQDSKRVPEGFIHIHDCLRERLV